MHKNIELVLLFSMENIISTQGHSIMECRVYSSTVKIVIYHVLLSLTGMHSHVSQPSKSRIQSVFSSALEEERFSFCSAMTSINSFKHR